MVVDVVWEIGGVGDSVVGVVQVADGEGGVLERPDPHEIGELASAVDDLDHLIAVSFHPALAGGVKPILGQDCVLQQLPMLHHMDRLQYQRKREVSIRVVDAGTVQFVGLIHIWTVPDTFALIAVLIIPTEIAGAGVIVPKVAQRTRAQTLTPEQIPGSIGEALRASGGGIDAAAAGDIAEVAGKCE